LHSLMLAVAISLAITGAARAQFGWHRYPQPDGGSIDLPSDWIVLRLADPVTTESSTNRRQSLVSARGVYDGMPIALNVVRMSRGATSPDARARSVLQGYLARADESHWMVSPSGGVPAGLDSDSAFAAFRSGSKWSHALCVVAAGEEAEYHLFLSSRKSLEGRVAPIRAAVLRRWRPSQAFREEAGIPLPAAAPSTVRFESGGGATLPANWFVTDTDAASEDYESNFLAVGSQLRVQRILNALRFAAGASSGDVVQLFRATVVSQSGEPVWVDRRMFNLMASELIATHRASWGGHPGAAVVDQTTTELVEVTLGPSSLGQHGALVAWRAGDECLLGFSASRSAESALENLHELREAYSPKHFEQSRRDSEQRAEVNRIAREFGAALVSLSIFGVPAIIGAFFSWRWALVGFILPLMCCGLLSSYGLNATSAWQSASGPREFESPQRVLLASAVALPLETFGESIPLITRSTMSELAWRATGGEGRAWFVMGSVIGLGAAVWLAVPLLVRFLLIRRRLRSRPAALAVGLAWWGAAVFVFAALSSANEGHRASALGAVVLTTLLVPAGATRRGRQFEQPI
jgi:hypothetical protein